MGRETDSSDMIDIPINEEKEDIEDLQIYQSKRNISRELSFSNIELNKYSEYDLTVGVDPEYLNISPRMTKIFIVVFPSKRIEVCYIPDLKMKNLYDELKEEDYIIIEADRGYDCAQIKIIKEEDDYKQLLKIDINNSISECKKLVDNEIAPKKIIRKAYDSDIELMVLKQEKECVAFEKCSMGAIEHKYDMELLCAEYQWDMQKLSFYFSSPQSIDFRELVQELYKHFKVRIWMCSIQKSKNGILKGLFN